MLTADRATGLPGHQRQSCVRGEVACGAELRPVPDSQEEGDCGVGTDAGHGGHDGGEGVVPEKLLELPPETSSLIQDVEKLPGDALDNETELGGGRDARD